MHFDASLANLWQSYQQVARHYLISAVCGNVLVKVARILPLAPKSCEFFSSSVVKDFFAVTLRQPKSKLAARLVQPKKTCPDITEKLLNLIKRKKKIRSSASVSRRIWVDLALVQVGLDQESLLTIIHQENQFCLGLLGLFILAFSYISLLSQYQRYKLLFYQAHANSYVFDKQEFVQRPELEERMFGPNNIYFVQLILYSICSIN